MADPNDVLAQVENHYNLEGPAESLRDNEPDKFETLVATALALLELEATYSDTQDVQLAALAVTRQANLMLTQGAESVTFKRKKQGPKTWEWADEVSTLDPVAVSIANRLTPDEEEPEYNIQTWLR